MRKASRSLLRTFHQCPSCRKSQRRHVSQGVSPKPSVFPRIFSTESESLPEESLVVRGRDHVKTNAEDLTSGRRMYEHLRSVVEKNRRWSGFYNPAHGKMQVVLKNRMPTGTNGTGIRISAEELLQSSAFQEPEESIFEAIENCISMAIDRLELYEQQNGDKIRVSHDQFNWLCSILEYQFSKTQLVRYGAKYDLSPSKLQNLAVSKGLELILNKVWNLEKEVELPPDETLITKRIPITARQRFFMVGEDGGQTLWRWVHHCEARIVADLNKSVLQVTASPRNLQKLEHVIAMMFKDVEHDIVDLKVLKSLGNFDAKHFLPVIARQSNTYLEIAKLGKGDHGVMELGIAALGKKRHRVENSRRLIFGSMAATFESNKDIYVFDRDAQEKNAVIRVLDSSLPWWAERDRWGRWSASLPGPKDRPEWTRSDASRSFLLVSSNRQIREVDQDIPATLPRILASLSSDPTKPAGSHSKIVCSPGHLLHNRQNTDFANKEITATELIRSAIASASADSVCPPHIFSPHNVNMNSILFACHTPNRPAELDHSYTLSFIASPWEFPDRFQKIPNLQLRVTVDPLSWEVTDLEAKLILGNKYVDILLPSLNCDLRIHREDYIPIPSADAEKSLTNYIETMNLDPSRNRRLIAPPFLNLDIDSDSSPSGSVKYFLTRVDYRKWFNFTFEEHQLQYTDVDGGDAWGRRKQVELLIADEKGTISEDSVDAIGQLLVRASRRNF